MGMNRTHREVVVGDTYHIGRFLYRITGLYGLAGLRRELVRWHGAPPQPTLSSDPVWYGGQWIAVPSDGRSQ